MNVKYVLVTAFAATLLFGAGCSKASMVLPAGSTDQSAAAQQQLGTPEEGAPPEGLPPDDGASPEAGSPPLAAPIQ